MINSKDPLSYRFVISNEECHIEHAIMEEILTEFMDKNTESDKPITIK